MAKVSAEIKVRTTNDWFGRFAASASSWLGSKWAFVDDNANSREHGNQGTESVEQMSAD
jgi:hypothetical protein